MADTLEEQQIVQHTLDLAEIARINRGDRVQVQHLADSTQELFDQTLALVDAAPGSDAPERAQRSDEGRFVPENRDLRTIYLLAEAVGGYETFHDLVNVHSPGNVLWRNYGEKAKATALSADEVRKLEHYQQQIHDALRNANAYLRDVAVHTLGREEMRELHGVILAASARAKDLNRLMGIHLMHEVEHAVERLYELHEKMRTVERSVDGIFLVDSELMFIPANELIRCVNTVFNAVGNSYLSRNIDGVILLAARNLLIDVVSFYSYYGKNQIYNVLRRGGSNVSTHAITARIRYEIRHLFDACKQDNKLVLTRIMADAQRKFEVSVEAIQAEAELHAVDAVKLLVPRGEPVFVQGRKKGFLRRLVNWLIR
jgi:hypothetical protein